MTPEEWNRKMDFIVEVQARTSVTLDILAAEHAELERWSRSILPQLAANHQRMAELIRIGSERLDESEKRLERAEKAEQAAQKRHEELLKELRSGFDRVLDKLSNKFS